MTELSVLFVLVGLLNYSTAAAVEGLQEIKPEYSILTVSAPQTKITFNSDGVAINGDIATTLKEYKAGDPKVDLVLLINDEADELLTSLSTKVMSESYDPAPLPDQTITFEYKPLLVTYTGTLTLTQGQLQELSVFSRDGDATLIYTLSTEVEHYTIPINFKHLIVSYHFKLEIMGDTVEGTVYAWLDDVAASFDLVVEDGAVSSESFSLNTGSLSVEVYSSDTAIILYSSLVSELTTNLLQSIAYQYATDIIGNAISEAVKSEIGLAE